MWSAGYDENQRENFPQVVYRSNIITIEQEAKMLKEIFKIFYLVHRDAKEDIRVIEGNKTELPYSKLYNLVFPTEKEFEFETEYLIALLNLFHVELHKIE